MSLSLHVSGSARSRFGSRLRHWRRLRGLSQAELGRRLGYDDSHISRVENTRRWPPAGMAERIDELLGTDGELAELWPQVEQERQRLAQRGRALATPAPVDGMEQLLDAYRAAGQAMGGRALVDVLEHHIRLIARQQRGAQPAARARLSSLAARYAELAGWARFDDAEYGRALVWYEHGREFAASAGDSGTTCLLLARQSAVHWSCGHSAAAIASAAAAYETARGRPALQARAAIARARGLALAGDRSGTQRALEEAAALTEAAARSRAAQRWAGEADAVLSVAHGTCHRDLAVRTGRRAHARAAVTGLLDALAQLPVEKDHFRALVTARLAGAYAWAGEPEAAAATLGRVAESTGGRVAQERRQAEAWLARHRVSA
ncbi:hypothetical protein GCM10010193_27030 [Kitasatospora atroaurantiaca]|uniref:Transcriptional regulator with XRE-family HTH domain n=1 Tax=Kitasatospora atroaurantiaca TaxID=285545 RepID=A0A561EK33_9ACTN|nr:helix-turn-helix transcriptional regulator [Kitasatospora atroaurantiaca]TWE15974.1 transcriptional regulator with XRE-family HTH domain [Kitasatospora atroaurantiaca]